MSIMGTGREKNDANDFSRRIPSTPLNPPTKFVILARNVRELMCNTNLHSTLGISNSFGQSILLISQIFAKLRLCRRMCSVFSFVILWYSPQLSRRILGKLLKSMIGDSAIPECLRELCLYTLRIQTSTYIDRL